MDIRNAIPTPKSATRTRLLSAIFFSLLVQLAIAAPALAQAHETQPPPVAGVDAALVPPLDSLKPGEFSWTPERATAGQLVIVVSLPEQRAHVYRNGVRIGVTTVSTGTPEHPTPTGTFEILQKKEMNYSNLYNNAPMPFMQRLTWDGIALHAGKIPGYPASHGCVRLPIAFAKKLYGETERGMLVVIADETSHGANVVYPGERAPVDTYSGQPLLEESDMSRQVASAAP